MLPRISRGITVIITTAAIFSASCHGGDAKHPASAADIKDKSGRSNSYYHFLRSQFSSFAQDDKSAHQHLTEALREKADSAFLWNQKAYLEAKLGNLEQSFKDAKTSLQHDANNTDNLLLMGKLSAVKQQPQKAVGFYRRALALDSKNEEAYNLLARDLLASGDKAGAVTALKTCLKALPEAVSCLFYLGSIHLDANQLDTALRYFNMIIAYNPDQSRVLNTVGEIYLKKGNYGKALAVFSQLSQLNPNDLVSQIRIGLLYYQLKELDKAVREFKRVSLKFPNADKVNYFLGLMMLEKGEAEVAFGYLNRIPPASTFFKEAMGRQVFILREMRDLEKALVLVESKFKSDIPEYYHLKTSLLVASEKFADALATLSSGLKKFKNNEKMLFQRAVVYDKTGQWDKARHDLETVIRVNPESPDAHNYLGYTLADRSEDLPTALHHVEKAMQLQPGEGHIMDSLGWVYFKMNELAKALDLVLKAAKLAPKEPTILEHAGDIYIRLNEQRKARDFYQKSLQLLRAVPIKRAEENRQIQEIEQKLGGG